MLIQISNEIFMIRKINTTTKTVNLNLKFKSCHQCRRFKSNIVLITNVYEIKISTSC